MNVSLSCHKSIHPTIHQFVYLVPGCTRTPTTPGRTRRPSSEGVRVRRPSNESIVSGLFDTQQMQVCGRLLNLTDRYRVFRNNCVISEFTATPLSPTSL